MILAIDAHYERSHAVVAGVAFERWTDDQIVASYVSSMNQASNYIPGQFYKRELPCILGLLSEHELAPAIIVIDGYVYLDGYSKPGLGWYLYDALKRRVKIIGVAKNPYTGITEEHEVFRGKSKKPLFVSCVGMPLANAKQSIASMHGKYRIPSLLKFVDQLSRIKP